MSRVGLYALVSLLAVCPSAVWPEGRALAESEAAGVESQRFDPSAVLPALGSSDATLRSLVLAGQRSAACAEASRGIADAIEPARSRLNWHIAHQCDDAALVDAALQALNQVSHPLNLWARLDRAEACVTTNPAAALALLPDDPTTWAGRDRAKVVRALALVGMADPAAEVALREIVEATAPESGAATVGMPLAKLLRDRDDVEATLEALRLVRRMATRAPLTPVGRQAFADSQAILATLPGDLRSLHALTPLEDEHHRARALFNAHRFTDAAAVYESLGERSAGDLGAACAAGVSQLQALSRTRDRREQLVALSTKLVVQCPEPETRAWAHYYAGQALARLGKPTDALQRFDQLALDAPNHSLVDDALFKSVSTATDLGDVEGALTRLRGLVEQHTAGDMHAVARFELAWRLRARGDLAGALVELEQLVAQGASESTEGLEGRAQYWRARILAQLGRTDDAVKAWRDLVLSAPLAYYGQQALARLHELRPALASELLERVTASTDAPPLTFRTRPELDDPAFARAIELLAVGEFERARDELAMFGALGEGADPELLWLVAALFDAAQAPALSSRIARDRLRSFMGTAPRGRAFSMWRIGFPRAFSPVIDDAAAEHGVPATFVRAVAREESAFDPNAVSGAGAHGLIQLMEATAREHAKSLKLPSTPAALHRPEVNVRIGAHFMQYLWKRYADNPAVVPAAYNAGHGAADRWLRERSHLALDEWIETIPYDETRRYTRRVLQSYGVYAMLDERKLPPLPASLPVAR